MKTYKIRKGSIAYHTLSLINWVDHSPVGRMVAVIASGFAIGAIFAMGMNEIHPLF